MRFVLRLAPARIFKNPAATSNLTQFSQKASTPMDRMRQMQFAEESPKPKESPATSKKPSSSGNALVGKALSAFEAEKQEIQLTADSPWNAIKVLLKSSGNFLLSANAGRSLLALAAVFVMRYRHLLLRKAMWKFLQLQGTVSFVLQWAVAKTVISAQHRAKLFFQAGLEHFGGHERFYCRSRVCQLLVQHVRVQCNLSVVQWKYNLQNSVERFHEWCV